MRQTFQSKNFTIALQETGQTLELTVSTNENAAGHSYVIPDRGRHEDYTACYTALARDFGTLPPLSQRQRPGQTFTAPLTPLLTENLTPGILYGYGDPCVLRVATDDYVLVVTSNDAPDAFPILRSPDCRQWQPAGFAFPKGHKPGWTMTGPGGDFWAPELHRVGSEFWLCFTARQLDGSLAIGLAKSSTPTGPFAAAPQPLLTGGVIDPHLFVADDGVPLLFWKEDSNDVWPGLLAALLHDREGIAADLFPEPAAQRTAGFTAALWPWIATLEPMEKFFALQPLIESATLDYAAFQARVAALESDPAVRALATALRTKVKAQPVNATGDGLTGAPQTVLENDQPWEAHLIEGIWVTAQQGRYYLFYAGNDFSTPDYGIGVAVGSTPLGPYRKMPAPLLRSTADWAGPGHPSVTVGPDGAPRLMLHGFFPGQLGYKVFRALLECPLDFQAAAVYPRRPGAATDRPAREPD